MPGSKKGFHLNQGFLADDGGPSLISAVPSGEVRPIYKVKVDNGPTTPAQELTASPNDVKMAPVDEEGYSSIHLGEVKQEEKAPRAEKPYAGMGKEDLLRFSDTPFWNRLRMICLGIFWLAWLGLLVAVIVLTIIYPRCKAPPTSHWWNNATFYQVYVKSFYDSDANGIGDFKGIEHKLGYLSELRTNSVMISAFYDTTRGGDFGYQLKNHKEVSPEVGTIADLDDLIREAHKRGIRVVIDFVPNYTGKDHPWFEDSRNNDTEKLNYYVWADCGPNSPPNNWLSVYGGSAWKWDDQRKQCYLHQFLEGQPELNLRSTLVRQELEDILTFWLDRGVDGFRVTSSGYLFEDYDLRDEPRSPGNYPPGDYRYLDHRYTFGLAENHWLIARWRTILEEYSRNTSRPRVLMTDVIASTQEMMRYYGQDGARGAGIPINYGLVDLTSGCGGRCVQDVVKPWIDALPVNTTANWISGSQDIARLSSRMDPFNNFNSMSMAVTVLTMTLPGAAQVYYGEEISMTNATVPYDERKDPVPSEDFRRDAYRTPMHWDNSSDAGFINGTGTPWLRVGDNRDTVNVQHQRATQGSWWRNFKTLADLRAGEESLWYGNIHYATVDDNIFSFVREYDGKARLLVAVNFGSQSTTVPSFSSSFSIPGEAQVVFSTQPNRRVGSTVGLRDIHLDPGRAVIFKWAYSR